MKSTSQSLNPPRAPFSFLYIFFIVKCPASSLLRASSPPKSPFIERPKSELIKQKVIVNRLDENNTRFSRLVIKYSWLIFPPTEGLFAINNTSEDDK